jgi:hypothetical protein
MELAFIALPRKLSERIREKADETGLFPEELTVELILQNLNEELDPEDLVEHYQALSDKYFEEAKGFLKDGDVVQASEKFWGAAALAVKMVAAGRGLKLEKHGSLFGFIDQLSEEHKDEDIVRFFHSANSLHRNFYEHQMTKRAVEIAGKDVEQLISKLRKN